MSIIAEFTVPAEAFALRSAFDAVPDLTVEVERLATHSREWVMPFLWASSSDLDAVERALRDDPSVDALQVVGTDGDVREFNVEWSEDVQAVVDEIIDQKGIVQQAEAAHATWYLELKFVDQSAVQRFQAYFRERDDDFELERLTAGTPPKDREYGLTPEQREVLVTALEGGYFDVPREAQGSDLAAELGVSTNAVSQRLRRATGNLVRNTLTTSAPDESGDGE